MTAVLVTELNAGEKANLAAGLAAPDATAAEPPEPTVAVLSAAATLYCDGRRITSRWELITPEYAAWVLAHRNRRNRKRLKQEVERFRREMLQDDWRVTHQGLAFADDGELEDGQNRLDAVVQSGRPQRFLVTRGLAPSDVAAMDRGKNRTLAHTLQILGEPLHSHRHVAVARAMLRGPGAENSPSTTFTDAQVRRFLLASPEQVDFGCHRAALALAGASFGAVLGRARFTVDAARLERFMLAVQDKVPRDELAPGDATARTLAKSLAANRGHSSGIRREVYMKCQNALQAYLAGVDMTKVYANERDLFPLPPEATACLRGEAPAGGGS